MSQKTKRFSAETNFGLNGNFFVRSYDELSGPQNKTNFYKKNFIGTIGGLEMKYNINNYSSILLGFSQSINKGRKNFTGNINGVDITIENFNIRHNNDFYQIGYERRFKKSNPIFKYHFGIVYARMHQQEISIENYSNQILIEERNFKNSGLEEGGIFGGIHITKKIDTKFEAGIKIKMYYLISVQTFEAITLSPTLTYNF